MSSRDRVCVLDITRALGHVHTVDVRVEHHPVNLERREEPVLNALPEAVFVHRLAEVLGSLDVGVVPWRGGEAELHGAGEMLENAAPYGVLIRTPAMALIDDDQVEPVGVVLLVQLLAVRLRDVQRLVQREDDLARVIRPTLDAAKPRHRTSGGSTRRSGR